MKTMNNIIKYIALIAVFISCNKEQTSPVVEEKPVDNVVKERIQSSRQMTFKAFADNELETKTSLDGYEVTWAAKEIIYLFDGTAPRSFTSDNNEPEKTVSFTGNAYPAAKYYAVYPYGTIDGMVITTEIPTFQVATAGSFAPKSNTAVAMTESNPTGENVLKFKNVGAVVKFRLSNSDVRKVRVDAIGGEKLSGKMTVTYDDSGNFITAMDGEESQPCVIMTSDTDLSTSSDYASGLRITFIKEDGSYKSISNKTSNTLAKNELMDFGILPEITSWKEPTFEYQKVTETKDFIAGDYIILSYDDSYYLPNAKSTTDPSLGTVVKNEGVINVTNDMKWTATASGTGLEFKSTANTSYYLWGGSANDAIRINTSSAKADATKVWKAAKDATYGVIAYAYSTKYLATNGTSNWRNYASPTASNRAANFYRSVSIGGAPDDPIVESTEFEITSVSPLSVDAENGSASFVVHSNIPWTLSVDDDSFISYSCSPIDATHTTVSIAFDDLDGDDRSCTFTVVSEAGDSEDIVFTQSEEDKETILISSNYSSGDKVTGASVDAKTYKTIGGIDFTFTRKNSSNQSYYDGTVIRFYKDDIMKMDASKNMKKIVFTMTSGYAALSPSTGSITESSYSAYTWEGDAASVTFTASAQSRFSAIEITY